ncbi:MAG: ABC transporter permease subunit [Planctomycetes bacterium]|nr:ABC transporter permease subunit [Planctomycetota bacterium]
MSAFVEVVRRLNHAQHTLSFRAIASGVIVALALTRIVWAIVVYDPAAGTELSEVTARISEAIEAEQIAPGFDLAFEEHIRKFMAAKGSPRTIAIGVSAVGGVALVAVWLGLGLSYLALGAITGAVVALMRLSGASQDWWTLVLGIVVLSASFTALLEGARLALGLLPGSVFAIARNVLSEAVRSKISLIFIVLVILLLAAIPGALHDEVFLRYKVQNFLSYGTRIAFWMIGTLTVVFGVSTITTEQRDKVIWQTMTKPVSAWQYLLGKWVGLATLGAILLVVCGTSIFLFTERLRNEKAFGEREPYVSAVDGLAAPTEDRKILHYQVLQSRVSVTPEPFIERDSEEFLRSVNQYIEDLKLKNPDFLDTPQARAEIAEDRYKIVTVLTRSAAPGRAAFFEFTGLDRARDRGVPLLLRYKIEAAENRPDIVYTVSFQIGHYDPYVEQCTLASTHVINDIPADAVDENGVLRIVAMNGDPYTNIANPSAMFFPPGGLEISYSVGGYQMNFLRVIVVMWVKLAFLAMLALVAGTFLSFPVACLVSVGTFIAAQSAGYLAKSVEYYLSGPDEGFARVIQIIVGPIAQSVAWLFSTYANLRPEARLVEGRLVPWVGTTDNPGVILGVALLGVWTVGLFFLGAYIFKKRELGLYSGQ